MISIVITTYGEDEWATTAQQCAYPSALKQLPHAYEVITHHEPDLTIGPARNKAAELATGEWLCFLDADDELEDSYLRHMTDAICVEGRPEPALLQPSVCYVRKGHKGPVTLNPQKDLTVDNYLIIGTVLRRELFNEVGGFNDYPHGFEDWSLWAKAWKAGAGIIKVPDAVYRYFYNPRSKHKQGWRDRKCQVETHQRVAKEIFG